MKKSQIVSSRAWAVAGVLSLAFAFGAHAAVYYSGEGTKNATPMTGCVKWYSDRARTTLATVTPAANDGNTYVFLASAKMSGTTFPAKAYWGCDGSLEGETKGDFYTSANRGVHRFDDCTLISGTFDLQDGPVYATLAGNFNLLDGKSFTFRSFYSPRNLAFGPESVFKSGENSILSFNHYKGNSPYLFTVSIEGDFSGFKGRYNFTDVMYPTSPNVGGHLALKSPSAFGDPTSVKDNAVTLGMSNYLSVAVAVVQSPTRGVKMNLSKGKRAGVYAAAGQRWTLTAPVTGTTGIFSKIGTGTTVLNGPFAPPTIDVEEGSLVLGTNGTFATGLSVHVANGAKLVLQQEPEGLAVACEEGGSVAYEIAYDPVSGTTPLALTAAQFETIKARFPAGIPVALAKAIALPQNEELRLPVLTISDGAAQQDDFLDMTTKTDGLPNTRFEIEASEGTQTVYLVARAVIDYAPVVKDYYLLNAAYWSNGKLPEPGADYRKPISVGKGWSRTGSGSSIKEYLFKGDSLTVCGYGIWNYAGDFFVPKMIVRGNSGVQCCSGNSGAYRKKVLRGEMRIVNNGTSETSELSYQQTESLDIQSTLVGDGRLKILSQQAAENVPVRISGDNAGFAGKLILGLSGKSYAASFVVTNEVALGGPLAAAAADGVTFTSAGTADCSRVSLTVERDVTFNAGNRGWTADYLTLGATVNQTLTLDVPSLKVTGALAKDGAGTLALKTALAGAGTNPVAVAVKEGYIKALDVEAWRAAAFTVADGAGFEVDLTTDDAALRRYGVRAASITPPAEGLIAVKGTLAGAVANPAADLEAAICTVPVENADLAEAWRTVKIHRYVAKVRKVVLDGDDAGFVTYVLHAEPTGLAVILK